MGFWTAGSNFLDFQGTIPLPRTQDSIETAYVSIEPMMRGSQPSNILMEGTFRPLTDSAALSSAANGAIGDYSRAHAIVTFTTASSDTNRAKQEFYLMRLVQGVPMASAADLPSPPVGWAYGLWVLDSNFYPKHDFFYGWFRTADSASSEWMPGEYSFPGGFYAGRPLNDPGARIEITLEPEFAVTHNNPAGPSPLVILSAPLPRFINVNDTLALSNAWNSSELEGQLSIAK